MSRGPPGEADWRAKAAGTAAALGAPAGPPSLPPGATRPGLVYAPGGQRAPKPEHSAPCLQDPPGVPGRRQHPLRTHARPPCAPSPRPQPGVVQPAALGSFQRRAPSESSPAQPPPPPRRSPPPRLPSPPRGPGPVQPGPALRGIVRTQLTGRSVWACSRLQRSVLRAQWPCRLPRHKAGALPTPLPPRPHWSACNLGIIRDFCSPFT